jgi:hypothetical protein
MIKKTTGIELLKKNFDKVESRFMGFFETGSPRWPSESRDYLRNHHQSLAQFQPSTITWENLKMNGLPDDILQETHAAFDAFKREEEYEAAHQ